MLDWGMDEKRGQTMSQRLMREDSDEVGENGYRPYGDEIILHRGVCCRYSRGR